MNLQSFKNIFFKFNTIIFITLIIGLLAFCAISINQALSQTAGDGTDISAINPNQTTFDTLIKSKLSVLKTSAENQANNKLPVGRIDPFWNFTE